MADLIELPDGSIEVLLTEDVTPFLRRIVADRLGNDVGQMLEKVIRHDEAHKKAVETESQFYEMSAENYHRCIVDAHELSMMISYLLNKTRIDRKKLNAITNELIHRLEEEM